MKVKKNKRTYKKPLIKSSKIDTEISMVMMSAEPMGDPFSFKLGKLLIK